MAAAPSMVTAFGSIAAHPGNEASGPSNRPKSPAALNEPPAGSGQIRLSST
jgi:hypothetical protein